MGLPQQTTSWHRQRTNPTTRSVGHVSCTRCGTMPSGINTFLIRGYSPTHLKGGGEGIWQHMDSTWTAHEQHTNNTDVKSADVRLRAS